MAGVGTRVGTSVPTSVGAEAPATVVAGPGPAGLRRLPAKQHAPQARPSPTTHGDRRRPCPGEAVKHEWPAVGPARRREPDDAEFWRIVDRVVDSEQAKQATQVADLD